MICSVGGGGTVDVCMELCVGSMAFAANNKKLLLVS